MVWGVKSLLRWLGSLTLIERESSTEETKVTRVKFGTVVAIALAIAALVVAVTPSARDRCIQFVETFVQGEAEQVEQLTRTIGGDVETPQVETPQAVGAYFDQAPTAVRAAIVEYFDESEWENAAHVAYCESGFRADAHNDSAIEDSRGIFQINVDANPDMLEYDLWSVRGNVHAAAIIHERQGWRAWKNCAQGAGIIKELSYDLPRAA